MSVLGRVAAGGVLEPKPKKTSRCPWSYEELDAIVQEGLLPAQKEFVDCDDKKLVGLIAGFGAGKTRALCAKCVRMAMDNPNTVAAVFEPTHQMVRDVWVKSFDDYLEEIGIEYDFRISPQPEYKLHVPGGVTTILCRATETYNRIRGQNLSFCLADEIDTSSKEIAGNAINMMLARLRGGKNPQLGLASTPEGYRICHQLFVTEGDKPDRKLIRARTLDNPHLPEGFVESLYANYSPQLLASYLEGEFTNWPQRRFITRSIVIGIGDTKIQAEDTIYGSRLQLAPASASWWSGEAMSFTSWRHGPRTPAMIRKLQETYPLQLRSRSRSSRRLVAPERLNVLSLILLFGKGGFRLKEQSAIPIRDRINSINSPIAGRLKVNHGCSICSARLSSRLTKAESLKGTGGRMTSQGLLMQLHYCIQLRPAPLDNWKNKQAQLAMPGNGFQN